MINDIWGLKYDDKIEAKIWSFTDELKENEYDKKLTELLKKASETTDEIEMKKIFLFMFIKFYKLYYKDMQTFLTRNTFRQKYL